MKLSLSWRSAPDEQFQVDADSLPELLKFYETLGGDKGALKDRLSDAVTRAENGDGLDPTVVEATLVSNTASETQASSAPAASQSSPSDPWADESQPSEPTDDDPWGGSSNESATPTRTPSRSSARPSDESKSSSGAREPYYDKFGREYRFDTPGAPECNCGETAAKMKAKKKQGNGTYTKWVCARAAGENWKSKCEYSEFVS